MNELLPQNYHHCTAITLIIPLLHSDMLITQSSRYSSDFLLVWRSRPFTFLYLGGGGRKGSGDSPMDMAMDMGRPFSTCARAR